MFTTMVLAAAMTQLPAPAQQDSQSVYFASILNYQRQARGLNLVSVDNNAAYTAYQNNLQQLSRGLGHWFLNGMSQCSAVGQPDAATVLNAWMGSPSHAGIIFDPNLVSIGFNGASGCWTLSGVVGYTLSR